MSYYQGDFYGARSGYTSGYMGPGRGDPGFWGFMRGIASKAVGAIPVVGPMVSPAISMIGAGGIRGAAQTAMKRGTEMVLRHPVISATGAAVAAAGMGAEVERMVGGGAACPKGYHPCKNRKHGCKKGPCVRNRHMNVCNPRALRRAARRAHGFLRVSRKLVAYYSPRKHKGKAYIRRPKKR